MILGLVASTDRGAIRQLISSRFKNDKSDSFIHMNDIQVTILLNPNFKRVLRNVTKSNGQRLGTIICCWPKNDDRINIVLRQSNGLPVVVQVSNNTRFANLVTSCYWSKVGSNRVKSDGAIVAVAAFQACTVDPYVVNACVKCSYEVRPSVIRGVSHCNNVAKFVVDRRLDVKIFTARVRENANNNVAESRFKSKQVLVVLVANETVLEDFTVKEIDIGCSGNRVAKVVSPEIDGVDGACDNVVVLCRVR